METNYPQGLIWNFFKNICDIPHPSGHEEKLIAYLETWAREKKFETARDDAGNLKITRAAAPGFENSPKVILQGHLDMVPCSFNGKMDFHTETVKVVRSGDFLHTDSRSTLGADNAIGVSLALSALTESTPGGELSALFTVEEETGLSGANKVDPKFLQGDFLLNIDSEEESTLIIGCAGGARLKCVFELERTATPPNCRGAEIRVSGLKGGHSGCDINKNHGNAILILSEIIAALPDICLAEISGGVLTNVIPSTATALIATADFDKAGEIIEQILSKYRTELGVNGNDLTVIVTPTPPPDSVWTNPCKKRIIDTLLTTPVGVLAFNEKWGIPEASNNLAVVESDNEHCSILLSPRTHSKAKNEEVTSTLQLLYSKAGAQNEIGEIYPSWEPSNSSQLLEHAKKCFEAVHAAKPEIKVMHAGLECGIFACKKPELQMISFGPNMEHVHSVNERLSIESTERVYGFLKKLLNRIWSDR